MHGIQNNYMELPLIPKIPIEYAGRPDKEKSEAGLETSSRRALEASLFIDKKFLDVSVITCSRFHPKNSLARRHGEDI